MYYISIENINNSKIENIEFAFKDFPLNCKECEYYVFFNELINHLYCNNPDCLSYDHWFEGVGYKYECTKFKEKEF
jgi:hypothetical protein